MTKPTTLGEFIAQLEELANAVGRDTFVGSLRDETYDFVKEPPNLDVRLVLEREPGCCSTFPREALENPEAWVDEDEVEALTNSPIYVCFIPASED